MHPPDSTRFTEDDKLHYEVTKLKLEAKALEKPYVKQPTTWVTIAGLLISIALNLSQCSKTKNEEDRAEINLARTQLAQEKANKLNDSIKLATTSLNAKMKNTQLQLDNIQRRVNDAKMSINSLGSSTEITTVQSNRILTDVKSTLNQINRINSAATEDIRNQVSAASLSKDLSTAKNKEQEGFQDLIEGNFKSAAVAFQASEDAYNGYHWSYELARLLKEQNRKGLTNESDRKALLLTIISKYTKSVPTNIVDRLKQLAT